MAETFRLEAVSASSHAIAFTWLCSRPLWGRRPLTRGMETVRSINSTFFVAQELRTSDVTGLDWSVGALRRRSWVFHYLQRRWVGCRCYCCHMVSIQQGICYWLWCPAADKIWYRSDGFSLYFPRGSCSSLDYNLAMATGKRFRVPIERRY